MLVILCGIPSGLFAQEIFLANRLGAEAGLSHSLNSFVFEDSKGLIWISSIDGLNLFDGKQVRVFKPNENDSYAIKGGNIQSTFWEDDQSNIWFSTERAVNCFRRDTETFDHYTFSSLGKTTSHGHHHLAIFLECKRWLWIAADHCIFRFDTRFPESKYQTMAENIVAARYTVDTFPNGRVKTMYAVFWDYKPGFDEITFNQNGELNNRIYHSFEKKKVIKIISEEDNHNFQWILSKGNLFLYEKKSRQTLKKIDLEVDITAITDLANSDLLIALSNGSIYLYNKQQGITKDTEIRLLNHSAASLGVIDNLYAKDRFLWVSVRDEGLFFGLFVQRAFRSVGTAQGMLETIGRFYQADSCEYWLLGIDQSYKLNLCHNRTLEEMPEIYPYSEVIRDKDGLVWAFSTEGLHLYNTKEKIWSKKLEHDAFIALMDVSYNNNELTYVASILGLIEINRSDLKFAKLSDDPTYSLGYDNENRLWQGGDNYIQIWKQQGDGLEKLIRVQEIGDVNYFHEQVKNNLMWVGTSRGLFRFDLTSLQYELINEQTGFPNQYIQSITSDKNGALWVATNQGIVTFDPNERPYHFINYTVQQGLGANEFRMGAVLHDSDGRLWFAHKKGVEIFHPDSVRLFGQAPRLALTGLKIHDKPWEGHLAQGTEKALELNYLQNTLQFNLAALEYTNPQLNQFKVRLLGIDTAWTHLGTQNFITYPNLSHGHYTFQFTAANAEGLWQETPYSLSIRITPPYWRTWWFYTLMALLFVGVVYGLFRYREIQRLKQEKLRLRIARDLHDEMGSTLSSISILSEAALHGLQADIDRARFSLIGERSRQVMEAMSDIVWSVNAKNDNMEKVLQRMKEFAVEILEAKDITLHFDTRQGLGKLELPMEQRKDFYLLFKEAINNAAKYSQASEVWVTLNEEGGHLALHIRDNGCGFDIQQIKRGNGLWNMQQRAERMGARFDLQSGVGEGTSIKITLH